MVGQILLALALSRSAHAADNKAQQFDFACAMVAGAYLGKATNERGHVHASAPGVLSW